MVNTDVQEEEKRDCQCLFLHFCTLLVRHPFNIQEYSQSIIYHRFIMNWTNGHTSMRIWSITRVSHYESETWFGVRFWSALEASRQHSRQRPTTLFSLLNSSNRGNSCTKVHSVGFSREAGTGKRPARPVAVTPRPSSRCTRPAFCMLKRYGFLISLVSLHQAPAGCKCASDTSGNDIGEVENQEVANANVLYSPVEQI